MVDSSIRPLLIALNRAGIKTRSSCSGILDDHVENYESMSTPYLCVNTKLSESTRLRWLELTMIEVGFHKARTSIERLKKWEKEKKTSLSKPVVWMAESESYIASFYFDFGTDFDRDGGWDRDYKLLDLPEWQRKIREAWVNLYKKLLHAWL